ncbi:MAG: hypothetical protein IJE53_07165 [Bacilli bacterium]|nr:hypothetical protein [Bacilli bacterium]
MASNRRVRQIKRRMSPSTQKYSVILGAVILIMFIMFVFYNNTSSTNYNNIKQDKGAYLVYTKYSDQSTKYTKEIPYVNLKADIFKEVNKDILVFCDKYMSEKSIITYEYDVNGIILSLVIKVINNDTTYAPEPYFRTYNINLEREEVIADDALLQFFGVTESNVQYKIKRQFNNYYSDIVKERYYSSNECSYECFMKWRGVTKYLDHVSYYVRDGKLIAFKSFIAHSIFGEEEYFTDKSFEFEIADSPIETDTSLPLSSGN